MRATYADLERMYDGQIPAEAIACCIKPQAPRSPVEWARWTVRRRIEDLRCVRELRNHPQAVIMAGREAEEMIKLTAAWIAYRAAQADERMTRVVDANIERITRAFA